MKTINAIPHPIAILSARNHESCSDPVAVLTADLSNPEDGWVQLLPAGSFAAPDGRPTDTKDGKWHLDKATAEQFIAATKAQREKILIDYDHQTLYVEQTGQKAPAAAWLTASTDIEWHEGKGIFIKPDWTKAAQKSIDEREYAFLSAVFPYDRDGKPLYLRMAAITNDPGLTKLESVASLAADFNIGLHKNGLDINLYGQTEDAFVNEALKKLLAKLGISADGELTDELATAALTALDALKVKADKADSLESQVVVLSAQGGQTDLTKFVPIETYNGVVSELAVLKADTDIGSIEQLVNDAKRGGKIVAAEVSYMKDFGQQQGHAALKAMLDARSPIAALHASQTSEIKNPGKPKDELNETELAVMKAFSLSKEEFLKQKEAE